MRRPGFVLPSFSPPGTWTALNLFRFNNVLGRFLERATGRGGSSLLTAFGASLYDTAGLRYDMPDHVHAQKSSNW